MNKLIIAYLLLFVINLTQAANVSRKGVVRALECRAMLLKLIEEDNSNFRSVIQSALNLKIKYYESEDWKDPKKVKLLEKETLPKAVIDPYKYKEFVTTNRTTYGEFFIFKHFEREAQIKIAKILQYSKYRTLTVLKEILDRPDMAPEELVQKLDSVRYYLERWTQARNLLHTTSRRLMFIKDVRARWPEKGHYDPLDTISDLDEVLSNCAELFNPELGNGFPTYAVRAFKSYLAGLKQKLENKAKENPRTEIVLSDMHADGDSNWQHIEPIAPKVDKNLTELADTIHYIAQQVLTPGQLEVFLAKHPRDGGRETSFHQVAKTRDVRRSGVAEQYHAAIKKVYEAMQILNVDVY